MSESIFPSEEPTAWIVEDGFPAKPVKFGYVGGLTKRELFAAMAMQGLLAAIYSSKEMLIEFTKEEYSNPAAGIRGHITGREAVSINAVSYADALIAELEKKNE